MQDKSEGNRGVLRCQNPSCNHVLANMARLGNGAEHFGLVGREPSVEHDIPKNRDSIRCEKCGVRNFVKYDPRNEGEPTILSLCGFELPTPE